MVLTDAERHSVVVFLQARRPARGRAPGERRSRRRDRRRICRSSASSPASSIRPPRSWRPGVIRHIEGNRFSLAETRRSQDASGSRRVSERFAQGRLQGAGRRPTCAREIWTKLWGNLSFNPISALTHATLEDICRFPPTRALAADMMREAQAVGEALGIRFRVSLEKRIAGAEAVGAHKTSMLQDVEAGRAHRGRRADRLGDRARRAWRVADAAYRYDLRARETARPDAAATPRAGSRSTPA